MSTRDTSLIFAFLRENPGATSAEIGTTPIEMIRLEQAGKVIRVGRRKTGKRGAPPVEWALPEQEGFTQDERVTEAQEGAQKRVDEYQAYMRSSNLLWRMRDEMGYNAAKADQRYQQAEIAHYERWPRGTVPPRIEATDFALAGIVTIEVDES